MLPGSKVLPPEPFWALLSLPFPAGTQVGFSFEDTKQIRTTLRVGKGRLTELCTENNAAVHRQQHQDGLGFTCSRLYADLCAAPCPCLCT